MDVSALHVPSFCLSTTALMLAFLPLNYHRCRNFQVHMACQHQLKVTAFLGKLQLHSMAPARDTPATAMCSTTDRGRLRVAIPLTFTKQVHLSIRILF